MKLFATFSPKFPFLSCVHCTSAIDKDSLASQPGILSACMVCHVLYSILVPLFFQSEVKN